MIERLVSAIQEANTHRAAEVLVTPLAHSPGLSAELDCELFLKCEHLQTTGSFKYRGAANKLRCLEPALARSGVITASSGNHGQAVALAGRVAGIPVTVYVSASASPTKLAAIRSYGAELVLLDLPALDVELQARRDADAQGRPFISPYNDLDVIAGQGTIGLELLEQNPSLDVVFCAVGGGGLISGLSAALKASRPDIRVVGCWPEVASSLKVAIDAGRIVDVEEGDTISDGTAGGVEPDSITLDLCRRLLDDTVLVSEHAIKTAMRAIAANERWMVEGAAGVALAGAEAFRSYIRGKKVAVIVCGRNIAVDKFVSAIQSVNV